MLYGCPTESCSARSKPGSSTAMPGKNQDGYGKPPVASQFRKGQTGNLKGRPKEYYPPFNPGIILQTIESEKISVLANGKRKQMSKAEIHFRSVFNKAAG